MMRAFSHRYRWHKRLVPMRVRPNDASMLTSCPKVLADADPVQLKASDDARTTRFASH